MSTVADYEHQAIGRLLDHVAEAAHDPATCDVCGALGLRQHLHDLATCVGIVAESGRRHPDRRPADLAPPARRTSSDRGQS